MRARATWTPLVALAVSLLAPGRAAVADEELLPGQTRTDWRERPHLYAGILASGDLVAAQVTDYDPAVLGRAGGGGGFVGGLRLFPFLAAEGTLTVSAQQARWSARTAQMVPLDSALLVVGAGDVRVYVGRLAEAEAYVLGGVGMAQLRVSYPSDPEYAALDSLFARGLAVDVGGGLDYWFGPMLSLGGRLLHRGIYFWEPAIELEVEQRSLASLIVLDVVLTVHL